MWLENAKQIPISYINVQLFPRGGGSTFANVLKREETSGAPPPETKLSSQSENMGLLQLQFPFLVAAKCALLSKKTHIVLCHCVAFKYRHYWRSVNTECVVLMYLRHGWWKHKNLYRDTVVQREIKQNQTQKTEKNTCHVSVSKT